MIQHGQVFKLKVKGEYGQPLWAYRYRLEGRRSARPQVGGFATRAEAQRALAKALERIGPGGRGATLTLAELVEEYLEMHQAEPVTIAKLRWLLSKATAELGDVRLAELAPKDVYAWRLTIPEGHRYEATQALRQVLNRAVAWGLIDYNPASAVFRTQCGARRRSDRSSRGSRSRRSRSGSASPTQPHQDEVEHARGAAAGGRARSARPPATIAEPDPVPERAQRSHRLSQLRPPALETSADSGRARAASPSLRRAPYLRNLRAARRRPRVCCLAVHGLEHCDDRLPLRPSRPRQPPACRLATRRVRGRAGGGRWVDAAAEARNAAYEAGFAGAPEALAPGGGRSVDVEAQTPRLRGQRKHENS